MNTPQFIGRGCRRFVLLGLRDNSITARSVFHHSLEPVSSTKACAHLFALACHRTAAHRIYLALCRRHFS